MNNSGWNTRVNLWVYYGPKNRDVKRLQIFLRPQNHGLDLALGGFQCGVGGSHEFPSLALAGRDFRADAALFSFGRNRDRKRQNIIQLVQTRKKTRFFRYWLSVKAKKLGRLKSWLTVIRVTCVT